MSLRSKLLAVALAALAAWGYHHLARRTALASFPTGSWEALQQPVSMTLYSLDPRPLILQEGDPAKPVPSDAPRFHGYVVLGQTAVEAPASRQVVAQTLYDGVRHWSHRMASCFQPRHGLRVTDASGTYDFVICFACSKMEIHPPSGPEKEIGLTGQGQPLTALLTAANIPLPPPE